MVFSQIIWLKKTVLVHTPVKQKKKKDKITYFLENSVLMDYFDAVFLNPLLYSQAISLQTIDQTTWNHIPEDPNLNTRNYYVSLVSQKVA
jgi:hypothetical protein